ncbi:hypothetical protein AGMMS49983_06150 [Clostridia bacterium]|nr:hypothetical protein AGMMS49983_06150 [Clostridia bacterium]
MKYNLEINYPKDKMLRNKLRFQQYQNYAYFDRPAVMFGTFTRYYLDVMGKTYEEYMKDATTHYEFQLSFQKWQIEHMPDDRCQSPSITVAVDFENTHNSAGFGAPIHMSGNNPPRVGECIETPEQADAWESQGIDSPFWKMFREWWETMMELSEQTELIFNGEKGDINVAPLGTQMIGPFMIAVEMVGTQWYEWLYYYPDVCHRLLAKITDALIEIEEKFRIIDPRPRTLYGLAEDDAGNCSADTFMEYSYPYDIKLYEKFGEGLRDGRSMHNCGKSQHLLEIYTEKLHVSTMSLYGFSLTPDVIAEKLAGKCYLWGNISPMLLASGDVEGIRKYAREFFDKVAPYGGIVFGEGANVAPGTPLENMALCVKVAEEYAADHPDMFTHDIDKFVIENKIEIASTGKAFTI